MHAASRLRVGMAGKGPVADVRRASLERLGVPLTWCGDGSTEPPPLDVLFVAAPVAERYALVCAAARQGAAVFSEWPAALSLRESAALVALAQEAGVTVGVSRTLRFHPALHQVDEASRLVLLRRTVPEGTSLLGGYALAELVDLCLYLTEAPALTRLDAQAARDAMRAPRAVAFTLRFQNGAYAQVAAHPGAAAALHLYACTSGTTLDVSLALPTSLEAAHTAETAAFLDAAVQGKAAPVTPLDALQTLRLVERVWARLR